MFRFLLVAVTFLLGFSGQTAFAQVYRVDWHPQVLSAGLSVGEPAGVNLVGQMDFQPFALRVSGLYSGSTDGAPNGAEATLFLKLYQGRHFSHSLFHMVGFGQFGHSVSNLHVYAGYGYQLKWNGLFLEARLPVYYKNNDDARGPYSYFKLGYLHTFRD